MDTETKEKNSVMNITEQQKAYENFKAFYYMLNASTDCKSIVYNKNIRVDKEDLIDLCTKVVDKFQNNYLEDGYKINVHLTFNDHKIVDFIAWDTFVNYKFPNTKLSNIVIEWEYMLKLPNYRLPQLHKLIVKISDGISPEEMLNLLIAGRLEDIDEFEQGVFPLAARVDFVNNVISDELLQIVKDWAEGVRLNDKNRRFLFKLKRFRRQIAYFLNYFTTFFQCFVE